MPVSKPGFVNYVGECSSSTYLCGLCEGDCDSDSDCQGDLICQQRSGFDAVAGCQGAGGDRDVYGKDVCVPAQPTTSPSAIPTPEPEIEVQYVGNPCTDFFADGKCTECTGDCDGDSDCAGDLRCAQRSKRSGNEIVPGCLWGDNSDAIRLDDSDFCES